MSTTSTMSTMSTPGAARGSRLDRLYARARPLEFLPGARDIWKPAWQPRGRWWMRANRRVRQERAVVASWALRRLARPARVA